MELLFQKNVIGYVNITSNENRWAYGDFAQNDNFYQYIDFFEAIVCEDGFDETQFDSALMQDNNWSINDNGEIIGICVPAIYSDGFIAFRYR